MRYSCRGFASGYALKYVGFLVVSLAAVGCGTAVTAPDGDVIDLDGINLNDVDLDGVDVDQDILNLLDIKSDTLGVDADVTGTDATGTDAETPDADATGGTDAVTPDADTTGGTDAADIAGGCTATTDCDDENVCTDDTCGKDGVCVHANNTLPCDDGNACTGSDTCAVGLCAGTTVVCEDDNPCTDNTCDSGTGCVFLPNTVTCDDANDCTENDVCGKSACAGTKKDCTDGNPCTTDGCQGLSGICKHYVSPDYTVCPDNDPCTMDEHCMAGKCEIFTPSCTDFIDCTFDSCDATTGECLHTVNTGACDDYDACTAGETCIDLICTGGKPVNCNDGNDCTYDFCSPGGCENQPSGNPGCSDGDACTLGDTCDGVVCLPSAVTTCDDGNPCTTDACDMATGCTHTANTSACDDGDPCTLADTCTQTVCEGTPNTCGQWAYNNDGCNTMVCDYTDGSCKFTNGTLWEGTFKTAAGWKFEGEWATGPAVASSGETFGAADPATDYDGDGAVAGTVIGGDIDNTPHDWYFLTSPVIDLSTQATSTFLYGATPNVPQYDASLILSFEWFAGLSYSAGQYVVVQISGDGTNWSTIAEPTSELNDSYWLGLYKMTPTGTDVYIPKEMLTKHFQFRVGYKVSAVEAVVPLVSGLTVDAPQIGIGNCWD